jgi:polysaccharide deacetylase 2 family uncharacterized protein YibQ
MAGGALLDRLRTGGRALLSGLSKLPGLSGFPGLSGISLKCPGPLALTSGVLAAGFIGLIAWLALSGEPPPKPAPPAPPVVTGRALVKIAPLHEAPAEPTAPMVLQDPALVEDSPAGPLPVIAPDGRMAWQVYAAAAPENTDSARIALVVTGLALNGAVTRRAIDELPAAVSLALSPYGNELQHWADEARRAGHEVLLQLPSEPVSYPTNDPGPHTLMTQASAQENIAKLTWVLARFTGYVGLINHMGSKFTASGKAMRPILEALKARGLLFVDSHASRFSVAGDLAEVIGLPFVLNNLYLDNKPARAEIDRRLEELAKIARSSGVAVGLARAYPSSIERIAAWSQGLDARGLVLAPVTAVARGASQPRNGTHHP